MRAMDGGLHGARASASEGLAWVVPRHCHGEFQPLGGARRAPTRRRVSTTLHRRVAVEPNCRSQALTDRRNSAHMDPTPPPFDPQQIAFAAVNTAFGSLVRICMALDGQFRVRHASERIDSLLGPGSAARLRGEPIEKVLGPELFGPDGPLRQALLAGEKREGWRALLRTGEGESRLLSVTAVRLQHDAQGICDPGAVYLVVLRPSEE